MQCRVPSACSRHASPRGAPLRRRSQPDAWCQGTRQRAATPDVLPSPSESDIDHGRPAPSALAPRVREPRANELSGVVARLLLLLEPAIHTLYAMAAWPRDPAWTDETGA